MKIKTYLATMTVSEKKIRLTYYNLSRRSLEMICNFFPEINVHIGQLSVV